MGTLWQDLKYGLRMLAKNPAFTTVAVLTLALGIGANTAIFSMVDAFLLRPLPVYDPAQITVLAFQQGAGTLAAQFSYADFQDIRKQTPDTFSGVIAYQLGMDGITVNGKPERIMTSYVSGNYFSTLGIQPAVGRFILPSEGGTPGADPVLVLGYSYWKTRFGGDPNIVGQKVTVDGRPFTIIGIAPEGFHGLYSLLDTQGFLPYGMVSIEGQPENFMTDRKQRSVYVLGRLKPGAGLKQARAALSVVAQRLAQQSPEADKNLSIGVYPERLARPQPDVSNPLVGVSGLFLALAALVLILACVNVANILLVRATVRQREMAIRAALGAARGRLMRQSLTESTLLAVLGGAAGILLGLWASGAISSMPLATDLPLDLNFRLDWRVFIFAFVVALVTGVIVGIVPAMRASRGDVGAILHEGGRSVATGHHRLRNALVAAQVSGSLMLLVVAGLFMRSLGKVKQQDMGFDPNHVLNLAMDPNEIGYNDVRGLEFYKTLLTRVRALPGVESASAASSVPMGYYQNADSVQVEGYQPPTGEPAPLAFYNNISTDYFKTMAIPLIQGRDFTDADDQNALRVAIVNETFVRRFWPNANPIGEHFTMATDAKHLLEVIGVARDCRFLFPSIPVRPYFYVPNAQNYNSLQTLQIRALGAPENMILAAEKEIQVIAPDLPLFDERTMTQSMNTLNGLLIFEFAAGLAGTLGILGLILALVGVYGVVSYATSQRTHEIGIRMALGAQPADVLKMVFREGFLIVGIGVAVGLLGAFAAGRVVGNFLVGVSGWDPLTFCGVSLVLVLVALTACYIPAQRAMRVDPMIALRYE